MLRRIRQCSGVGRFDRFDHPTDDSVKLRRLSLVYARNAAGKSTLARVLTAASRADADEILLDRRIGHERAQQIILELDERQVVQFDGTRWSGPPFPRVLAFDRPFIEANVYVGRNQTKKQRKNLLRLALGPDDVGLARKIDELAKRGRDLAGELKPHDATIRAAAKGALAWVAR